MWVLKEGDGFQTSKTAQMFLNSLHWQGENRKVDHSDT